MLFSRIFKEIQERRDPIPSGPRMSKNAPIEIVSSTNTDNIRRWCSLALKHRCHFRNGHGSMEGWYNTPKRIDCIVVALHNGVPVGVTAVIKNKAQGADKLHNIGTYVKYNFRRLGIGTKLVNRAKHRMKKPLIPSRWDSQSEKFYDAAAID